jgi:hypothetical protein
MDVDPCHGPPPQYQTGFCDNCELEFIITDLTKDPEFTQFWYCQECYLIMLILGKM